MKLLHVTHSKNINSIIRHGLLPSYIDLDHHWDVFQEHLLNRQCIYLWNAETYRNTKYVRDMIYTKMFIHPRNRLIKEREIELQNMGVDEYDEELYFDFKKIGKRLIGEDGRYLILEMDSNNIEVVGSWEHVQEPHDNKYGSTVMMDEKYAHNDKELYIVEQPIDVKNIRIVEEVLVRKYKNHNLGFTFR
jgi:hypothetical protein